MKKSVKILSVALIAIMAFAMLVACGPASDPDKALSALKKNEYQAAEDKVVIPTALALSGVKDLETVITGSKVVKKDDKSKIETITIIYFKDSSAANDAWDKVKEYANKENKDKDSDFVIEKSGAMIYFGTKQAVKDAR